jgi:hypothetical protein
MRVVTIFHGPFMTSENSPMFFRLVTRCVQPLSRFFPAIADIDEKRKRLLVIAGELFIIPLLMLFIITDLHTHDTLGAIWDGSMELLIVAALPTLFCVKQATWIYRCILLALAALCSYNSFLGTSGESSLLWLLIYPLIIFYVLGIPEGLYWFCVVFCVNFITIMNPELFSTFDYPIAMRMRFFIAWIIIAFFTLLFELLRWYFHAKLTIQSKELQAALENIKTLNGLLPICSICKRIRDDGGYWNQVEDYLSRHTDAMLTHGICDDCLKEKYPDIYSKRMKTDVPSTSAKD